MGKLLHTDKTLLRPLSQCSQHNLLHGGRKVGYLLAQGWRWRRDVLHSDLNGGPAKRRCAREPLVDHRAQSVLVTGEHRIALQLFRGLVEHCSRHLSLQNMRAVGMRTRRKHSQAKVTEQYFV